MEKTDQRLVQAKFLPRISVIIPTYHDWEKLQLCLDSLERQTFPKSNFEILVVNNDPSDIPPKNLSIPTNCKFLEESKPGSYAARNKAISSSNGQILAFTDADCQPHYDWLKNAVNFFSDNPQYDRIGGKIVLFSKNNKPNIAELYDQQFELRQDLVVPSAHSAMTANMIAKKEVFESIGLFDDELFSMGDFEWGQRAHAAGFRINYVENCIVYHPARSTLKELSSKTKRMAGGFTHLNYNNKRAIYSSIVRGFIPPIYVMLKAKNKGYSKKGIAVYSYLKMVRSFEIIRVLRGKEYIR